MSFWLAVGLGSLAWLAITLAGSLVTIGDRLGAINRWLEMGFYAVAGCAGWFLLLRPVLSVFLAPAIALESFAHRDPGVSDATCRRLARYLIRRGNLKDDEKHGLAGAMHNRRDLREPLQKIVQAKKDSCLEHVREQAVMAFLATAISQSGRLDALALVMINIRMVRVLVEHFGYRPPVQHLVRIYANVFVTALLVENLEELDWTSALPHGVTHFPGAHIVASSLMQGVGSALFTLRVGIVTRNCLLNVGQPFVRAEARKAASREAVTELGPVCLRATQQIPGAMSGVAEKIFG
jgi:hypothetical protein